MAHYTDQTFAREDIVLDGHRFGAGVVIRGDCRLLYSGGPVPVFDAQCQIEQGAVLVLDGAAAHTMQLLALLCQAPGEGGRRTVERTFHDVCHGSKYLHVERGEPG